MAFTFSKNLRFRYSFKYSCPLYKYGVALILFALLFFPLKAEAQLTQVSLDRIRTLQILQNGREVNVPCIELGSSDRLQISFDDLTKEYHRYIYRVEHCGFDWQKSTRIFESDYLSSSDVERPIEDYHESLNTTQNYTHYSFSFPNNQMGIKLSGNYRVRILDDDEGNEVCSFCFYVVESLATVNAGATTNTDIDLNKTHQQLSVTVNPQSAKIVDASREIKIVVVQNGDFMNAVRDPKADYFTPQGIRWEHNEALIFPAGNEFRKFEMTNLKTGLMGVDNIKWFPPYYHATLFADKVRRNYVYDEEQNGNYIINDADHEDDEYEADYLLTHFLLLSDPVTNGAFYVYGGLTNWNLVKEAKMKYSAEYKGYEATLPLKEGYYNYEYVFVPDGGGQPDAGYVEGNFFQTGNEYSILVYYLQRGSRYDRLIGVRNFKFEPSKQ